MPPSSSSSPLLPLLLLLPLLWPAAAAENADCRGIFRAGQENFVLDTEDAVREGAALLATAHVRSAEDCERACCEDPRCNQVLLEPRGTGAAAAAAENHTCVLFNCVHRNRFVCRFVNKAGYRSYVRESVFVKYLQGPGESTPAVFTASISINMSSVSIYMSNQCHATDPRILVEKNPDMKPQRYKEFTVRYHSSLIYYTQVHDRVLHTALTSIQVHDRACMCP